MTAVAIVMVGGNPPLSEVELEVLFRVGAAMSFPRVVVGVLFVAADAHMLLFETVSGASSEPVIVVSGLNTSLSRAKSEAAVKLVVVVEDKCTSSLMVDLYEVRVAFAFVGAFRTLPCCEYRFSSP